MRDNRSGEHAEVRACALKQAFGRHVSLGQLRETRIGTFDAVDSFNRRASTVAASMSASRSEVTRSESQTGNRINGTKGDTMRDGSQDRVPFRSALSRSSLLPCLSRCWGAKLHVRRGCWRLGMRYPARGGWSAGAVAVAARAGRAVVQVCASGPRRQVAWWPAA
jgi:hypothetical protein